VSIQKRFFEHPEKLLYDYPKETSEEEQKREKIAENTYNEVSSQLLLFNFLFI